MVKKLGPLGTKVHAFGAVVKEHKLAASKVVQAILTVERFLVIFALGCADPDPNPP